MSMKEMHSAIVSPQGNWWLPAGKQEKRWVTVAFLWCMVLFAMMPLWHFKGGQNPSGVRSVIEKVDGEYKPFQDRVDRFVNEHKVGEENGMPVVAPPPGSEVYLLARRYNWYPILKLKKGVEYNLHLSAMDVNHGFSLFPVNVNFQVIPGYDYALKVVPNKSGDFRIICNEFCGIGHHMMIGKVVVED